MAQQWAGNNSEIVFEIVCSQGLRKQTKNFQFYMQVNFLYWVDTFKTMFVVRITIHQES